MSDYIRSFLNVGIMALCVTLSFFGVLQAHANTVDIKELTPNWMWPSDGVITDLFGTRQGHHKGIDIAAPTRLTGLCCRKWGSIEILLL